MHGEAEIGAGGGDHPGEDHGGRGGAVFRSGALPRSRAGSKTRKGIEDALKANPLDLCEQCETQLKVLEEAYGEAMPELRARKKPQALLGEARAATGSRPRRTRTAIDPQRSTGQGLRADACHVPVTKLCVLFGVPRRSVYCKPTKAAPKLDPTIVALIKPLVETEPSFGCRTVAWLPGMNRNTRVFQLKGWQACRRPVGSRPRIEAKPSAASAPNERWSTDLARVWAGKGGWATLALVMDCHTREVLGWRLSHSGKAATATTALEHALIARFGTLGRGEMPFLLRSHDGLLFTSRAYTALVTSYGLRQEFITPHCPQQNGMMERLIRSLKEQCVHRQRFESLAHADRAIGDWIGFCNDGRPQQVLGMRTRATAFELAP